MCSQEKQLSFGLEIPSGIISSLPGMNTALKSLNSEIHKQAKKKKNLERDFKSFKNSLQEGRLAFSTLHLDFLTLKCHVTS